MCWKLNHVPLVIGDFNFHCLKGNKGESLKSEYNSAMEEWKADTQAYADWKKKGQDEKMTDEEINTGLSDWNTKLAAWNSKMAEWNERLTGMQAAAKTTHDAMMIHMDNK